MNYEQTLKQIVLPDERTIVLTGENRGAMRGLPSLLGQRFVDCGIAEQAMIGVAAGLALAGRIPIVHALAAFLTMRAFEFVRTDVGLPALPVKLVGSAAGFLSDANGPTHQAIEDVALMRGIPNLQVFCPADIDDLVIALPAILASPQPCYLRYNPLPAAVEHDSVFEIGRAEVVAEGEDVMILTYGMLLAQAVEASRLLAGQGVAAGVLNLRTLKPIDEEAVLEAARQARLLVTLEDHFVTGGLYSIVAELLLRRRQPAHVLPIAFPGDLHHENILAAQRGAWLAIDPKGVCGEPAYEVGALLRNPIPKLAALNDLQPLLARRVDLLAELLGFDRQRLVAWGAAQAVLSAWWSVEDHGHSWELSMAVAESLAALLSCDRQRVDAVELGSPQRRTA